ncbi:hypothetical protein Bca4012_073345 [Brassica carinata]
MMTKQSVSKNICYVINGWWTPSEILDTTLPKRLFVTDMFPSKQLNIIGRESQLFGN